MDSDDERLLQEEEAEFARNAFELPQRPPVWIRTYEREEFAIRREYVFRTTDAKEQGIPLDSSGDIRGMWRIRRLWTSVAGFYEGKLDLAGRSERRWYSLKRRFDRFMVDLASLRTHILTRPPTVLDGSCEALLLIVSSPSALNDFKHKYKLGYVDLPEILAIPEMMDALYPGCPKAVIQKLFLTDLPPELLLYIFELAHLDDARALGATCHALNDLSLPYIYQTRRLVLHVDPTYLEKALEEFSDMDRRYLTHLSARMRTNLLADFGFLLARDDILKRVEHLVIQSLWTPNLASAAGFNARREAHSTFFSPIWKQIEATLSAVTNLREFNIEKIVITQNMIHAIASLRGLQTLSIHNCPVYQVAPWEMPPTLSTVVNLILFPQNVPGVEMLEMIGLVPNVRSLTVTGLPKWPCTLPIDDFRRQCNPFRVVERVNFSHIDDEDVSLLFNWIHEAAVTAEHGLRITHLRLELKHGLQRDEVFQLIGALEGAPLRTLALEGISYVKADLFTHLAEAFPNLSALTLIHRQNTPQRASRPSRWPDATWEYAARLAAFPCLRHFMWNFDLRPLQCSTTFDLPYAEAGYPATTGQELYRHFEENCFETAWDILPRLFCAYCPTLEALIFSMLDVVLLEFTMARSKTGKLVVQVNGEPGHSDLCVSNNPIWPTNTSFENPWHVRGRPLQRP